jgi:hypothetical protein
VVQGSVSRTGCSGFGEPAADYQRLAGVVPWLRHLPSPGSFGPIRLDRFSPNFFDAERLGFKDVRPLVPYRHVYPFSEDVLRNLAYYFSYDYREPRDVAGYVRTLARELRELAERVERTLPAGVGDNLVIADSRPKAKARLTVLRGLDKALYEACDSVTNPASLAAALERAGFPRLSESAVVDRLAPLVERGLVLGDGLRYLGLAVAVGDYVPSTDTARALLKRARARGRRERSEIAALGVPS